MTSKHRWILILVVSCVADLIIRIWTNFNFGKVMVGEAVLFSLIAFLLAVLLRFDRNTVTWAWRIRITLVWFFALGGVRSILWISGWSLPAANVVTLGTFLVVFVYYVVIRRPGKRSS